MDKTRFNDFMDPRAGDYEDKTTGIVYCVAVENGLLKEVGAYRVEAFPTKNQRLYISRRIWQNYYRSKKKIIGEGEEIRTPLSKERL